MPSVKQGDITYRFLSFWYDLTWDWTPVSWTIGKHSNHYANSSESEYSWKCLYVASIEMLYIENCY